MSTLIRIRPSCNAFTADAILRRCGYVLPHFTFPCERTHGVGVPRQMTPPNFIQAKSPALDPFANVDGRRLPPFWRGIDWFEEDDIGPADLVHDTRQQFERLSLQHPVQTLSPAKDQGRVAP